MTRPAQPDLFPAVPSRASPDARRAVSQNPASNDAAKWDVDPHDFPDSDAYRPRGIGNVPEHLRMWIDDDEWGDVSCRT